MVLRLRTFCFLINRESVGHADDGVRLGSDPARRDRLLLDHRPHSSLKGMKRFVKENSLSLFFLAIFLLALLGQAISGHNLYNEEALQHKESTISFWRYLTSSDFGQAVMENWQSEYLQFALFGLATVWLLQKGSSESKELDKAGTESDKEQKVGEHAEENSPGWAKVGG